MDSLRVFSPSPKRSRRSSFRRRWSLVSVVTRTRSWTSGEVSAGFRSRMCDVKSPPVLEQRIPNCPTFVARNESGPSFGPANVSTTFVAPNAERVCVCPTCARDPLSLAELARGF